MKSKEDNLDAHISFLYDFVKSHKTTPTGNPVLELSFDVKVNEDVVGILFSTKRTQFTKGNLSMKHPTMHFKKTKVASDREPLMSRTPDSLRDSFDWDVVDIVHGQVEFGEAQEKNEKS